MRVINFANGLKKRSLRKQFSQSYIGDAHVVDHYFHARALMLSVYVPCAKIVFGQL